MQELGHPVDDFEGRIDFSLRDEIRLEQAKHGMVPDGCSIQIVRGLESSGFATSCAIEPSSAQAVATHTAPVTACAACSAWGVR